MPKDRPKTTKAELKKLEKALASKPVLVWDRLTAEQQADVRELAEDYKNFLNAAKTEREAVREISRRATPAGFTSLTTGTGKKLIHTHLGKVAALVVLGDRPLTEGLRIIVSHIDAPRLDLKPRPLYEDTDMVFLKTHYYGGLKKYQWLSRPLALHGYIVKDDGRTLDLVIGENNDDPVLTITDLLPHLARKVQADKKVTEAFPGEKLNLLVGCLPLGDEDTKNRFKLAVLNLLNQRYGLVEADFISAELEVVPAGPARDVGLDRGLIGGYGQDDRICAFASLTAMLKTEKPSQNRVTLFVDREETGSDGATGAKSHFLEGLVAELLEKSGQAPTSAAVRKALLNSKALSADVEGALDPDFQEVHEKNNAARVGYGPCLVRYTGSGGKYGASEAPAPYMGWLRGVFKRYEVLWQSSLLGKIDEGGGGTVAMFLAKHGLEIVDCGPALLGMHSPFEIVSAADLYMTVKAYQAFYQAD